MWFLEEGKMSICGERGKEPEKSQKGRRGRVRQDPDLVTCEISLQISFSVGLKTVLTSFKCQLATTWNHLGRDMIEELLR